MSARRNLLVTLSALATAAGVAVGSAQADTSADTSLHHEIATSCGISPHSIQHFNNRNFCCAVIGRIGDENIGLLQAVALGDPNDSRFAGLSHRAVHALLGCSQEALDRLAELAIVTRPSGNPSTLYVG